MIIVLMGINVRTFHNNHISTGLALSYINTNFVLNVQIFIFILTSMKLRRKETLLFSDKPIFATK